ncbi:hypothetical protein JGU66_32395 [Myxococcaceae bacterium JPH2]|nr:hypothetical protein [Myxococcaceae bacterium JPH2]
MRVWCSSGSALLSLLLMGLSGVALAHSEVQDLFHEGLAGPYRLFVTVRPPAVIPGIAEVRVRTEHDDVDMVEVVPLPLEGAGSHLTPAADVATRSERDSQSFQASLWLMTPGAWQVRVTAHGKRGSHTLAVPVRALPTRTEAMSTPFSALLLGLLVLLWMGAASVARAAAREARLAPGEKLSLRDRRRGNWAFAATALCMGLLVWVGGRWWREEAKGYEAILYQPLKLAADYLPKVGEGTLALRLEDPGWLPSRRLDDLVPDHEHLMHVFIVRVPEMDRVYHLHPEKVGPARFERPLPPMPAGRYQVWAEVVHATGMTETLRTELLLPDVPGEPARGDDALGTAAPLSQSSTDSRTFTLEDGARMVWLRDEGPLSLDAPGHLRFRVENAEGHPAGDLEPYMGMLGHAAIVRTDREVFAHVHPSGSVSMAALDIARAALEPRPADGAPEGEMKHAGCHGAVTGPMPSDVSFPFGFSLPGRYRLFIQVKRHGTVQTAVFDARAGGRSLTPVSEGKVP